jgi:NAD(P)-dependent dehydrogenase (short-subunit alcohol dehydrogenase family)
MDSSKCGKIGVPDGSGDFIFPERFTRIHASYHFDNHLSTEIILMLVPAARIPPEKASRKFGEQKEMNMKKLEGKVAVVTGGNSGIGLATAKRLQEEGARVAISGRSKKTLDEAVKTIGNGVVAVQSDVAKLADIDKLFAEVSQKLGKIDVLFVNAGVAKFAPLADTSESTYDEMFDINIKGAYFTIQKALPFLNDGASIILNTSVADSNGTVGASAYSGTKAALRSLARTAAAELVGRGIRVNAVAPGPIVTPIFGRTGLPQEAVDEFAKGVIARVPMKRFGQPEEVAGAVAFLASQDASYITGVEINVDGGYGQI